MKISLANIHLASEQEVFDQVATHLLTQNKRSLLRRLSAETSACRYRADNLTCAAGCLISNAEYIPACESNDWNGALAIYTTSYPMCATHKKLITELQHIHDRNEPDKWSFLLQQLAESNQLNTTVIKNYHAV